MKERFETFTVLIAKINRSIRKIKNQEMAEYGLRGTQISCLYYLYAFEELTATELCERCEEDKATVSRALESLEKNGFVVCRSASAKRYKSPLFLTEKGKEVGKRICDKIDCVLDEVSIGVSEEERASLYRVLSAISDHLEAVTSSYAEF